MLQSHYRFLVHFQTLVIALSAHSCDSYSFQISFFSIFSFLSFILPPTVS